MIALNPLNVGLYYRFLSTMVSQLWTFVACHTSLSYPLFPVCLFCPVKARMPKNNAL